ncbi:MAG: hypothetical protein SWH61_05275 [Thermodesulfobacteriota bacterium]|nr:hypothetical protein [Thermodesulfobacteriota bacterium]
MTLSGIRTHITIGGLEVMRCPEVVIDMHRHRPVSRAMVTLNDASGVVYGEVSRGDAVTIRLGYRNESPAVWAGAVRQVYGDGDQVIIQVAGVERAFTDNTVCQSFYEETPEAIVHFAIGQTGLPAGQIDSPGVVFPRFVASDIPVWQVVRQCEHTCQEAFGLDMSGWALWVDAAGEVNWGNFDEPGDIPAIATGAGLIKHTPHVVEYPHCLHMVETFLLAGFRHSQLFRIADRRRGVEGAFRALTVTHRVTENQARTFIGYGEPGEKF